MIYFLIIISCFFLISTLHKQFSIKNKYLNNGYINHRKAFILDTIFMILICIGMGVYSIFVHNSIIIAILLIITFVSIIKWLWFKNYDFNIITYIEKFFINLLKKR